MSRIGRRRCLHRSTQMSASVSADVRIGRRRCPHRSAQMSASVGADAPWGAAVGALIRGCSSLCCTDKAVGALLTWLVHLRQVHPLSAPLGKAEGAVVVLAYTEFAVDKAHELHGGEEAEATVRLAVDSVVEDVAQTLLAHAEFRDEDIVAA